jgi:hypothetical protein
VTLTGPDGKPQTILRTDLEELASSGKSAMPEGLEKDLKPQDFADLIAHLRGAAPTPQRKTFARNTPEVVRANPDGSIRLAAHQAEIYGPTVVLEDQYSNLGYWGSEDDHAVWTLHVERPGKYVVTLDYACANDTAGNSYVIQTGLQQLYGKVTGTGTWDQYRQVRVGELTLTAGEQRLTFRSSGKINGHLIDLRLIRLTPTR